MTDTCIFKKSTKNSHDTGETRVAEGPFLFLKKYLEKGEGVEKKRERNIDVRETLVSCLLLAP